MVYLQVIYHVRKFVHGTIGFMSELRNFGPLLPKINGQELGKFVYLRLNYSEGIMEIISIEDESKILVKLKEENFH